jgi:hypothetical protein
MEIDIEKLPLYASGQTDRGPAMVFPTRSGGKELIYLIPEIEERLILGSRHLPQMPDGVGLSNLINRVCLHSFFNRLHGLAALLQDVKYFLLNAH